MCGYPAKSKALIFTFAIAQNMAYQPNNANAADDAAKQVNGKDKDQKKPQPKHGRRPSQLDVQELAQLKEVFKFMDKDENGTVDSDEIKGVLSKLGVEITGEEIKDIMASLDENGDGVMDFDEFVQMMDRRMSINSQYAEIEQTFKVFDKNGDGKITFDELKEVLTALGEEVTDKDVMDMVRTDSLSLSIFPVAFPFHSAYFAQNIVLFSSQIKEADLNGDGAIDFEEFKIMMTANHDDGQKAQLLSM